MWKRVLIGGVAGAIATGPMSVVVWGFHSAGIYRRKPAPEAVAESTADKALGPAAPTGSGMTAFKTLSHVGFGTAGGAAFGLLTTVLRPSPLLGVAAGMLIWKGSYDGWIPAANIMPPPQEDEQRRQSAIIAAHVVYGLSLGTTVRLLDRAAARHG